MTNKKECNGSGTIINESVHPILGPQFYPKKCNGCKNCKKVKSKDTIISTEKAILPMRCYVPFLFAQKHKLLLLTILSALMLFYVNLGLPYRVRHREEGYHYIYWFA